MEQQKRQLLERRIEASVQETLHDWMNEEKKTLEQDIEKILQFGKDKIISMLIKRLEDEGIKNINFETLDIIVQNCIKYTSTVIMQKKVDETMYQSKRNLEGTIDEFSSLNESNDQRDQQYVKTQGITKAAHHIKESEDLLRFDLFVKNMLEEVIGETCSTISRRSDGQSETLMRISDSKRYVATKLEYDILPEITEKNMNMISRYKDSFKNVSAFIISKVEANIDYRREQFESEKSEDTQVTEGENSDVKKAIRQSLEDQFK